MLLSGCTRELSCAGGECCEAREATIGPAPAAHAAILHLRRRQKSTISVFVTAAEDGRFSFDIAQGSLCARKQEAESRCWLVMFEVF